SRDRQAVQARQLGGRQLGAVQHQLVQRAVVTDLDVGHVGGHTGRLAEQVGAEVVHLDQHADRQLVADRVGVDRAADRADGDVVTRTDGLAAHRDRAAEHLGDRRGGNVEDVAAQVTFGAGGGDVPTGDDVRGVLA